MKATLLTNLVVMSVLIICVTIAAINFGRPGILFWYMLAPLLSFSYKETPDKPEQKLTSKDVFGDGGKQ